MCVILRLVKINRLERRTHCVKKGKEYAISKLYKKYPALKPKFADDLPKKIPKSALEDLKIPEEIKEKTMCECEK